ncbi:MAG: hypothetical protein ABI432_06490 [Flavobacteriales bacterium]
MDCIGFITSSAAVSPLLDAYLRPYVPDPYAAAVKHYADPGVDR